MPVPLAPGLRLTALYRRRLCGLARDTRQALLIAAAYQGDDLRVIGSACFALDSDVSSLAAAEEVELVRIGAGRLTFAHPLVRGAVYHRSPAAERRSVHAALAGVLRGDSRAWHLGIATLSPDEAVAGELEAAGAGALARRGPGPASAALERAARLSPDADRCARRLLAAGEAAFAGGLPDRAVRLLDEAAAVTTDSAVRAAANHRAGQTLVVSAQVPHALELLTREAERSKVDQPSKAAAMLSEAALACLVAGDCRHSLRLARAAADLIEPAAPREVGAMWRRCCAPPSSSVGSRTARTRCWPRLTPDRSPSIRSARPARVSPLSSTSDSGPVSSSVSEMRLWPIARGRGIWAPSAPCRCCSSCWPIVSTASGTGRRQRSPRPKPR